MQPEPASPQQPTLPLIEYAIGTSKEWDDFSTKISSLVSAQKIQSIADITKGQRTSNAWHLIRKGRLTASNFGAVIQAKKVTPSLVKRVLGDRHLGGVKALAWGNTHESDAINCFVSWTGLCVEDTGVWLDNSGILGASPDGLVGEDSVLEVKCPFSHRDHKLTDCLTDNKFCLEDFGDGLRLKEEHLYWHQVQGQMYLTGRQYCYFVVWTLKDFCILKISKDPSWAPNLEILKKFYKEHIFPTIIS